MGSPEATALQRCEQSPRSRAAPQILMQVGPHNSRRCRKGPQGATPRTRPPAPLPLGRRPQAAWSVHCTTRRPRTLVPAPSIKRISSSNPEGPLRDGCRRPAPPSTSGLFYPDARLSWLLQPREIQHRRALHNVQHGLPRGPGQAWCSRLPGGVQCQGGLTQEPRKSLFADQILIAI